MCQSVKSLSPHEKVVESFLEFYRDREWEQFHSPKNLVMDLGSEVAELLDLFRWLTEEQSRNLEPEVLSEVQDEIADVFKALVYLCHKLNIDPIKASFQKLEKMKEKYPVEKCKGKSLKHTAYA